VLIGISFLVTGRLCGGVSRVEPAATLLRDGSPQSAVEPDGLPPGVMAYPERASCPHRLHLPDFVGRDPGWITHCGSSRSAPPSSLDARHQLVVARNEGSLGPWIGPFLLEMTAGIAAWIALYAPAVAVSNAPAPRGRLAQVPGLSTAPLPGLSVLKSSLMLVSGPRFIRWPGLGRYSYENMISPWKAMKDFPVYNRLARRVALVNCASNASTICCALRSSAASSEVQLRAITNQLIRTSLQCAQHRQLRDVCRSRKDR